MESCEVPGGSRGVDGWWMSILGYPNGRGLERLLVESMKRWRMLSGPGTIERWRSIVLAWMIEAGVTRDGAFSRAKHDGTNSQTLRGFADSYPSLSPSSRRQGIWGTMLLSTEISPVHRCPDLGELTSGVPSSSHRIDADISSRRTAAHQGPPCSSQRTFPDFSKHHPGPYFVSTWHVSP